MINDSLTGGEHPHNEGMHDLKSFEDSLSPTTMYYGDERMAWHKGRIIVWFSCGATSAVAAKLALNKYKDRDVRIIYCDTASEHEDNYRFLSDCETWYGQRIEVLKSEKYEDIWDVFLKSKYLELRGARCTSELKKKLRMDYEQPDDHQVFGFDSAEDKRITRFRENNPEVLLEAILYDRRLSKSDCLNILREQGITPPAIYEMGYRNANCLGCVKGGSGYWNKIRVDFPDVFDRMAKVERTLNVAICKSYKGDGKRKRVFLDELPPTAGRYSEEPSFDCGVLCQSELDDIQSCDT